MIARVIVHIRYLQAWWGWFTDPQGDFGLDDERFTEDAATLAASLHRSLRDCPIFDCVVCLALRDPHHVGRQAIEGDAILEIATWLVANGFADMEAGERQQYACYLRRARADYEKAQVTA